MSTQPETDLEYLIPAGRESFRVWEVAAILRRTSKAILQHIEAGKFGPCINCGLGLRTSYTIPRAGLIKFLRENSIDPRVQKLTRTPKGKS